MLTNAPGGYNMGGGFDLNVASDITIAKDGNNYYGFVINYNTSELIRLDFGSSLANIPTPINFADLDGKMPGNPTCMYLTKDGQSNWFLFIGGGKDQATSTLARLDFRTSLANTPNIANFGNMGNVMNVPKGLFVDSEAGFWYIFWMNNGTSELYRYDIGNNISYTPVNSYDLGNLGGYFSNPTDMAALYEGGNWYFFVTDATNNKVVRVDMGNSLTNLTPSYADLGNPGGVLASPSSIAAVKDCGSDYLYITNYANSTLSRFAMPAATGPYATTNYGTLGNMSQPAALTRFIRDYDYLYCFAVNDTDNTITQFTFKPCTTSSIASSSLKNPPVYKYYNTGWHNVYFEADAGLPTMQADCKQIYVEDLPNMVLSHDTLICQDDTIFLKANAPGTMGYYWDPFYKVTDSLGPLLKAWPDYSVKYNLTMPFPDGCIVDTFIQVNVSRVWADAGADRTLNDGSSTVLGGPLTSYNITYQYEWFPPRYLSDVTVSNPVATPPYDFTYYLKVTELNDTLRCTDIDTVVVHVNCGDVNLPNAFVPGSGNDATNKFRILNQQFAQLNYFRIFDRWGNEVFQTTDPSTGWDGNLSNGQAVPAGVYVWVVDAYCPNGQRFKKSGNVTLLR
jgi:gliding motility-associated-like protein